MPKSTPWQHTRTQIFFPHDIAQSHLHTSYYIYLFIFIFHTVHISTHFFSKSKAYTNDLFIYFLNLKFIFFHSFFIDFVFYLI